MRLMHASYFFCSLQVSVKGHICMCTKLLLLCVAVNTTLVFTVHGKLSAFKHFTLQYISAQLKKHNYREEKNQWEGT